MVSSYGVANVIVLPMTAWVGNRFWLALGILLVAAASRL